MIGKHTTSSHVTMLIADMGDKHLLNMVKMVLRAAVSAKASAGNTSQVSEFTRALYDAPQMTEKEAAIVVRESIARLMPYITEMWLRGIGDELRQEFVQLLDRQGLALLPRYSEEDLDF